MAASNAVVMTRTLEDHMPLSTDPDPEASMTQGICRRISHARARPMEAVTLTRCTLKSALDISSRQPRIPMPNTSLNLQELSDLCHKEASAPNPYVVPKRPLTGNLRQAVLPGSVFAIHPLSAKSGGHLSHPPLPSSSSDSSQGTDGNDSEWEGGSSASSRDETSDTDEEDEVRDAWPFFPGTAWAFPRMIGTDRLQIGFAS